MPAFGEVYRQSRQPILWIKGVHSDDRLTERDLQPDAMFPPIANPLSTVGSGDAFGDADIDEASREDDEESVEMYQSEAEEEMAVTWTIELNNEQEAARALALDDGGSGSESDTDEDVRDDDGFDGFDLAGFESEGEVEELERQTEGDEIKERAELLRADLVLAVRQLEDLLRYPSGHPHLREVPHLHSGNMVAVLAWAKRSETLDRVHNFPRTWGTARRGNVYK